MDAITCDAIDRLVATEMRPGGGIPRGVIQPLYAASREVQKQPGTFLAADGLRKHVRRGDRVLVVTGAGTPPWLPKGETDGPLGAAAIARAIEIGLGAKPVMLAEERNLGPVIAATEAAGLAVVDAQMFTQRTGCAIALPLPLGEAPGRAIADSLFREHKPAAIIFVEKAGPNAKGLFHSLLGTSRTPDTMANAHFLAERAKAEGVFTIGIGDGGNEIGCGVILEAVRDIQPFGRVSKNPEDGGIATVTTTDVLVFASTSNWGAYGIAAALAGLLGNVNVLHDTDTERRMLERCVDAGAMDGVEARQVPLVDGTSLGVQLGLITMLREIVQLSLRTIERGF
jgi:hypothetical protein